MGHAIKQDAPEEVGIVNLEVPDLPDDVQRKGIHCNLNTIEGKLGSRTGHDTAPKTRKSQAGNRPHKTVMTMRLRKREAQYTLFARPRQQCSKSCQDNGFLATQRKLWS